MKSSDKDSFLLFWIASENLFIEVRKLLLKRESDKVYSIDS